MWSYASHIDKDYLEVVELWVISLFSSFPYAACPFAFL